MTRNRKKIGWIIDDPPQKRPLFRRNISSLQGSVPEMRCGYIAQYLNDHLAEHHHELYDPSHTYDDVVIIKKASPEIIAEAERIKAYGGRTFYDCNVNYYEIWGDYTIPGTKPTEAQQRDVIRLTKTVDTVIADSSYLQEIASKFNRSTVHIPDNVNPSYYYGRAGSRKRSHVRLVWSGVSKKAAHLLALVPVFKNLPQNLASLTIVSDALPAALNTLSTIIPTKFYKFSHQLYRKILIGSDVIISPNNLNNAYEMGHTEYKITLGMAVGLPAVASPLRSYCEAIALLGGGIIAHSPDEWVNALTHLANNPAARLEIGEKARETVLKFYSTPVIAEYYRDLFRTRT